MKHHDIESILKHPRVKELSERIKKEPTFKELSEFEEELVLLSAYSNFLVNFSLKNPRVFKEALLNIKTPLTQEEILNEIKTLTEAHRDNLEYCMRSLRVAKKSVLLKITLQDILGIVDLRHTMSSLTALAESLIEAALKLAETVCIKRYGEPDKGPGISIIGVGKLGAQELNYSSDIDIIAVYGSDSGKTSGVLAPSGLRVNRITCHEFYCKVVELLNRILSAPTEQGIVYRVDLRLRPQGQQGPLALSTGACKEYYESWGRTWERMVMIRARPVAGSPETGRIFMEIVRPFVWQRSVDYSEIEEIRAMKKKIDSTFLRDDIKRGYGGIREAEFFVQTLQLMFSRKSPQLQTHRMDRAVESIRNLGIIPSDDLDGIYEGYLFLRRVEHYLQMKDDLQTHTLPKDEKELELLALKMGYSGKEDFLTALKLKRMRIKSMYNTLLGTEEDVHAEALFLLTGELRDDELLEFLRLRGLQAPEKGVRSLRAVAERMTRYSSEKQRKTAQKVVPLMVEECLRTLTPDRALTHLEQFLRSFGMKEAYLSWFSDQMHICRGLIRMFATSSYLSRLFLSDHLLLDNLLEESLIRKTYHHMALQLSRHLSMSSEDISRVLAEFRRFEEFRLGLYYLMDIIRIEDLFRYLSHLAEIEINACLERVGGQDEIVVVGMGKLGGREMTFGSDLDLIMVAERAEDVKMAESTISFLTRYTDKGPPYSIDMRLRPDGSKGTLIKSLRGYREYYLEDAQQWEVQALLKARPVAGPAQGRKGFFEMVRDVIKKRAREFDLKEIVKMRKKIVEEVSKKRGIDVKFGEGGIEEIEFFLQGLQIVNSIRHPELIVQNTDTALRRLYQKGIISEGLFNTLKENYRFYRRVETLLRLNEQDTLPETGETIRLISGLLGMRNEKELVNRIKESMLRTFDEIMRQVS